MKIDFHAKEVSCSEAIDWEIVQVAFDSVLDGELNETQSDRVSPYLMVGENFEFPGSPHAEWHDGDDWSCGVGVRKIKIGRNNAFVDLMADRSFSISFDLSDERYEELKKYLRILFQRTQGVLVIENENGTTNR